MGARRDEDIPDLATAWSLLDQRIGGGLHVSTPAEDAVHVEGIVHGRAIAVDIAGQRSGSAVLRELFHRPGRRRNEVKMIWQSQIVIGTSHTTGLAGVIDSFVDTNSPHWNPGVFDPRNGRVVRADPPALGALVLDQAVVERLSTIIEDVRIHVGPTSIGMRHEGRSGTDPGGYVAGCVLHHPLGPVVPWPDRALVGPWFWLGLLDEIAARLEQRR